MNDADFRYLPDLAGRLLGGSVVHTNDEFYADVHTLIAPGPATHDLRAYGPRGKVYDGWETRRRRDGLHGNPRDTSADTDGGDFVIVRLAAPGVAHGVNIDTSFFRGNYPPLASLYGASVFGYPSTPALLAAEWSPLLQKLELEGDSANVHAVETQDRLVTHVKLVIYPDGGVARLRVHGEVVPDPRVLGGRPDLAATVSGGVITGCSNMFYGSPSNVLAPGIARVMSDGWETARRRDDGNDWLQVRLGAPGLLSHVEIDTSRFVGNAPGWASLSDADTGAVLLERTALVPDTRHRFRITSREPVAEVRLDIYPDGGISRLSVHGEVAESAKAVVAQRFLDFVGADQQQQLDESEFFA